MVFLLKKFIEARKNCFGGAYKINILEEIKKAALKEKPIIVIDLWAFLYMVDPGGIECVLGGRHILLVERVSHVCQKLVDAGAELVFFSDGPIKENKLESWMKKADEKYEAYQVVFEANRKCEEIDLSQISNIMSVNYHTFQFAVAKFGKIHISFKNESDADLVSYANRVNAMAIVSGDTDFLIFPGNWRIWTTERFDIVNFTTIEWNKKNFQRCLMLNAKHLPVFATLCGNDFMPKECVEHIRKVYNRGVLHKHLAMAVRKIFPSGVPLSQEKLDTLFKMIWRGQLTKHSEKEIRQFITNSLTFYSNLDAGAGLIEPSWLDKHVQETNSTIVYILTHGVTTVLHQSFVDCREPNVKTYCELALPIFQRQMGIVLQDKDKSHTHEVCYKLNHEEPFQRRKVEIIKPDFDVPPIDKLLLDKNVSISEKLNILCWLLVPDDKVLRQKVEEYDRSSILFVPTLVMYYLQKNNQITTQEADAFMLSLNESTKIDKTTRFTIEPPKKYNPKAFWMGIVYNHLRNTVLNCLIISGLFDLIQEDMFDGFIFHKVYKNYVENARDEADELIDQIKAIRIYSD